MNYYELLGVHKNATQEDIKRAYKAMALKYHPDKPTGDAGKFMQVQEAYEILSNPNKRSIYDLTFESNGDILHTMINTLFDVLRNKIREKFKNKGGSSKPKKNKAMVIKLPVTLEEIYRGDIKKIMVKVSRGDTGYATVPLYVSLVNFNRAIIFPNLGDDQKQDIIVKIIIQEHEYLMNDTILNPYDLLYKTQDISLHDFYTGIKKEFPFLDGETISVDATFKSSESLVIKIDGKGLPITPEESGDVYIYFKIVLPKPEDIPKDIIENILSTYFK